MAGNMRGLQARIRDSYTKAIYTHCFAHRLNLALIQAVELVPVQKLREILTDVGKFFISPKRRHVLNEIIGKTSGSKRTKTPSATRWTALEDVNKNFVDLFDHILDALDSIEASTKFTAAVRGDAGALLDRILNTDIVLSSVVRKIITCVLAFLDCVISDLPRCAQTARYCRKDASGSEKRILRSYGRHRQADGLANWATYCTDIKFCRKRPFQSVMEQNRIDAGHFWRSPIATHPLRPQSNERLALPDPKTYFKENLAVPFIQKVIDALDSRFQMRNPVVKKLAQLLPRYSVSNTLTAPHFRDIVYFYRDDIGDIELFPDQFAAWLNFWKQWEREIPATVAETLEVFTEEMENNFRSIHTLLSIYAVIPVSTASGERTFSQLKLLKSAHRSTMLQDRLNGVALLRMSKDRKVDPAAIAIQILEKSRLGRHRQPGSGSFQDVFTDQTCEANQ
jgi:hAT family C-terminal dimerisation region